MSSRARKWQAQGLIVLALTVAPAALPNEASPGTGAGLVRDLTSEHGGYAELQAALARYRVIESHGGWPSIPGGPSLSFGHGGPRVRLLRRRLAATGDLAGRAAGVGFDSQLVAAVRHFQARHGLEVDGVVGRATLEALNVPVSERIRQLAVNLERHRHLPANLGDEYVLVNLPAFRLQAHRGGKVVSSMAVIVGQRMWQTPAFMGTVTYLVFRPYWNVPETIAVEEVLPKLRERAGSPERQQFEALRDEDQQVDLVRLDEQDVAQGRIRIRQKPGPGNALGLVKFMFPNEFDVYLHDTPAEHLFDRLRRDLSHGCIRVERPVELAEFVLQPNGDWPRERIEYAMRSGENDQLVKLDRPIPVQIVYLTAWVDPSGVLQFRKDIYGQDAIGPLPDESA